MVTAKVSGGQKLFEIVPYVQSQSFSLVHLTVSELHKKHLQNKVKNELVYTTLPAEYIR